MPLLYAFTSKRGLQRRVCGVKASTVSPATSASARLPTFFACLLSLLLLQAACVATVYGARVDDFAPKRGSLGGGTELRIIGTGFANGEATVQRGSVHVFIGDQECAIIDYTASDTSITCVTPPYNGNEMVERGMESYFEHQSAITVHVTRGSWTSPAWCANSHPGCWFAYRAQLTPWLRSASLATPPGGVVEMRVQAPSSNGDIFDVRLGSPQQTAAHLAVHQDGAITGVASRTAAGDRCVADAALNDMSKRTRSWVRCLVSEDATAGHMVASMDVSPDGEWSGLGSAVPDEGYFRIHPGTGALYTTTVFPIVAATSVTEAGLGGGAPITIYGAGFSPNPGDNTVLVHGQPCDVTASSANTITCRLPNLEAQQAQPDTTAAPAFYPRGRGLVAEVWLQSQHSSEGAFYDHPRFPDDPDIRVVQHEALQHLPFEMGDKFGQRLVGLFAPQVSGYYQFYIWSDDWSELSMNIGEGGSGDTTDPAHMTTLAGCPWTAWHWFSFPDQISDPVWLNAGQRYFTQVLHNEWKHDSHFRVAARIHAAPATVEHEAGSQGAAQAAGGGWVTNPDQIKHASVVERQNIKITATVVREVQTVTVAGAAGGHFRLHASWVDGNGDQQTRLSDPLAWNQDASTIRNAVRGIQSCYIMSASRAAVYEDVPVQGSGADGTAATMKVQIGYAWDVKFRMAPASDAEGHATLSVVNEDLVAVPRVTLVDASGNAVEHGEAVLELEAVKTTSASPRVRGEYRVAFDGEWTAWLPYNAEEVELGAALEALDGIDNVRVGDVGYPVDGRLYKIDFRGPHGNVPQVVVDDSLLEGGLDGVTAVVTTIQEGSVDAFIDPLPAELFEVPATTPGVEVFTNGIKAAHAHAGMETFSELAHDTTDAAPFPDFYYRRDPADDDCEDCQGDDGGGASFPLPQHVAQSLQAVGGDAGAFNLQPDMTPLIAGAAPATVTAGDSLTITGAGFAPAASGGGVTGPPEVHLVSDDSGATTHCDVTGVSDTQVQCTVPHAAAGAHQVHVIVGQGHGMALPEAGGGPIAITYSPSLTSLSATSGSYAGGSHVTFSGTGFHAGISATVGGAPCEPIDASYSSFTCTTPHYDATVASACAGDAATLVAAATDCTVAVEVLGFGPGELDAASQSVAGAATWTYAAAETPLVQSIEPDHLSAAATAAITIHGSNLHQATATFGDDMPCVSDGLPGTDIALVCYIVRGAGLCGAADATSAHSLDTDNVNGGDNEHHRRLLEAQRQHHLAARSLSDCVEEEAPFARSPTVHVPGLGNALVGATQLTLGFHVATVSPPAGSLAGGTTLHITGGVFVPSRADDHRVVIAVELPDGAEEEVPCYVVGVTEAAIDCDIDETPDAVLESLQDLVGQVRVSLGGYAAPCSDCSFAFSEAVTPQITAVQVTHAPDPDPNNFEATFPPPPSTLSLDIEGSFGSVEVLVGDLPCTLLTQLDDDDAASATVVVDVPHDTAGDVLITVNTDAGAARLHPSLVNDVHDPLVYTHPLKLYRIAPVEGSTQGGRRVHVYGRGLAPAERPEGVEAPSHADATVDIRASYRPTTDVWFGDPTVVTTVTHEASDLMPFSYTQTFTMGLSSWALTLATPTELVVEAPSYPTHWEGSAFEEMVNGYGVPLVVDVEPQRLEEDEDAEEEGSGEGSDVDTAFPVYTPGMWPGRASKLIVMSAQNYTWDATLQHTPHFVDMQPREGVAGTVLNVTGRGLGTDATAIDVQLGRSGGSSCAIDASEGVHHSHITGLDWVLCTVQEVPAGNTYVRIHVAGKGYAERAFASEEEAEAAAAAAAQQDDNPFGGGGAWSSSGEPEAIFFISLLQVDGAAPSSSVSLAGGSELQLTGQGFGPTTSVLVCGQPCERQQGSASSYSSLVCTLPPLHTAALVDTFPAIYAGDNGPELERLQGSMHSSGGQFYLWNDNRLETDAESTSDSCFFAMDLGEGSEALVRRIRYHPAPGHSSKMVGMAFEGSHDGIEYTPISSIGSDVKEGWNAVEVGDVPGYRHLRVARGASDWCHAAEVEFLGYKVVDITEARDSLPADSPATDAACPIHVFPYGNLMLDTGYPGLGNTWMRRRLQGNKKQPQQVAPHQAGQHPRELSLWFTPSADPIVAPSPALYTLAATAYVDSVEPGYGTSFGGTLITLTGSGFQAGSLDAHAVTVAGIACDVQTVSETAITCTTRRREEHLAAPVVTVEVDGHGPALVAATATFTYMDKWSELSTWFASDFEPPVEGDTVVIPEHQAVLLDVSPPRLFLLLVQGTLVFDAQDLALDASYILVQGGTLQIGTPDAPFEHHATITLHGDRYTSVELPHVGAKVLGVMNRATEHDHNSHLLGGFGGSSAPEVDTAMGTLDIHGTPRLATWALLEATVDAGTGDLYLDRDVDWAEGEELAIASSSTNPTHAETVTVLSRPGPRHVVVTPVRRQHESFIYTPPAEALARHGTVDMRVEVGLLSRNVVIQGDENSHAQKFGATTIAAHGGRYRISNAELRNCGQSFLLGRYCSHMHVAGDMAHSYIAGNSIHHSFHRAVTIHGTHNTMVRDNVAYDVMGHTYFVEDGVETGNTFKDNLGMVTRKCSACLKSDTKPATFWTSSPANVWEGNRAAGSTAFGFWFELSALPVGAHRDVEGVCPLRTPLQYFADNTAHSNSRVGLRIYPFWTPMATPCDQYSASQPVYLHRFTSFASQQHALFCKECGDIHFVDAKLVGGTLKANAFVEQYHSLPYVSDRPFLDNTLHVARLEAPAQEDDVELGPAIWGPQDEFFHVRGSTIVNWGPHNGALSSCAKCDSSTLMKQGGYTTRWEGMLFVNSPKRVSWVAPFRDIFRDLDGSLSGQRGWVTPYRAWNHFDTVSSHPGVVANVDGYADVDVFDGGLLLSDDVQVRRVALDNVEPAELDWATLYVSSDAGADSDLFKPRDTYGWVFVAVSQRSYSLQLGQDIDWRRLRIKYSHPDYVDEGVDEAVAGEYHRGLATPSPPPATASSPAVRLFMRDDQGAVAAAASAPEWLALSLPFTDARWRFEATHNGATVPSLEDASPPRLPRPWDVIGTGFTFHASPPLLQPGVLNLMVTSIGSASDHIADGNPGAYSGSRHRFELQLEPLQCDEGGVEGEGGCPTPPVPPERPVGEPVPPRLWSDPGAWPLGVVPTEGVDVTITTDMHIVLDVTTPVLGHVKVEGVLEALNEAQATVALHAHAVIVWGELRAGQSVEAPWAGTSFQVVLYGDRNDRTVIVSNDLWVGNKVLLILGEARLYGRSVGQTWTRLAAPAAAGDTTIVVAGAGVGEWQAGDRITLSPTEYGSATLGMDTVRVSSVEQVPGSAEEPQWTVTLDAELQHDHFAGVIDVDAAGTYTGGQALAATLAAAVGHLSRSIIIRGHIDAEGAGAGDDDGSGYGGHVLVGNVGDRVGSVVMDSVELRDCGKSAMDHAALLFAFNDDAVTFGPLVVTNSALVDTHNHGIVATKAPSVTLVGNVVHNARRVGVRLDRYCSDAVIASNLVVGVHHAPRDGSDQWLRPVAGFYLDVSPLASLAGNVVGGSHDSGFVLRPPRCDDAAAVAAVAGNEAHGGVIGAFLLPHGASGTCVALAQFQAWKNSHVGVLAMDQWGSLQLDQLVVADNHIGIAANFISSGEEANGHLHGGEGGQAVDYLRISNSMILGSTAASTCSASTTCLAHTIDDTAAMGINDEVEGQNACGSVFGDGFRRVGLLWPQWSNRGKTCDADHLPVCRPPNTPERLCSLPWEGRYGTPSTIHAQVELEFVMFGYFQGNDCGQRSVAVALNPSMPDYAAPMSMAAVGFHPLHVQPEARFLLEPVPGKSPGKCFTGSCDSFTNVFITDVDGSVTGSPGGTVMGPEAAASFATPDCPTFDNQFGSGHTTCPFPLRAFAVQSIDDLGLVRKLGPVTLARRDGAAGVIKAVGAFMDGCAKRSPAAAFPLAIQPGLEYDLALTATAPTIMALHFFSPSASEAVLVHLFVSLPNRIKVFVGGVEVPPLAQPSDPGAPPNLPTLADPAGTHVFDPNNKVLHLVMRGGGAAGDHAYNIVRTSSIAVDMSITLDVDAENFYGDDLIHNLAALLGIDPSRIKLVGVDLSRPDDTGRRVAEGSSENEFVVAHVQIVDQVAAAAESGAQVTLEDAAESASELSELSETLHSMAEEGTLDVGYDVVAMNVELDATDSNEEACPEGGCDECPDDPNKTEFGDCGCGVADTDADGDGISDCLQSAPDPCDVDSDGDGVVDCNDGCPNDGLKTAPGVCGCGAGDGDADNDGVADCMDGCDADPNKADPGSCGCGVADTDSDSDGTADCNDDCPNDAGKVQPGACGCGASDADSDGDGVEDCHDGCPDSAAKSDAGFCGCEAPESGDVDGDGFHDCVDGCPFDGGKSSPGACGCGMEDSDTDGDGLEDCVDDCNDLVDSDGDGTPDCHDLCPDDANKVDPGQCGCGVSDVDVDGDGIAHCNDGCPGDDRYSSEDQTDCGCGQVDADGDGVFDCPAHDSCPNDAAKASPGGCGCGFPDVDSDGDGAFDCDDVCPQEQAYMHQEGPCGCDPSDSDGDGTLDCHDFCAGDAAKVEPGQCGCGVADHDSDGDGVADCNDGCPDDPGKTSGGVCGCFASDGDSDGDGEADCVDGCPYDAAKLSPGSCGCGVADVDSDGDGVADCNDGCPEDGAKVQGGACGCGVSDDDSDGDGLADCIDGCPNDPGKVSAGSCGCGAADSDSDGDGVADCNDGCPDDPDKAEAGVCGCFESEQDSDGDGEADCVDGCPYDAAKLSPGSCGCGVADVDSDGDGVADCNDGCPDDGAKVEGGACGCGASDDDADDDGLADCVDGCPGDANKEESGACGCGVDDGDADGDGIPDCFDDCNDLVDGDGDGTPDCSDACPEDGAKTEPGQCGCGVSDHDSDGDGVADCNDGCADDPGKTSGGVCGCGASDDDSDGDGEADCVDGCPHDAAKLSPGSCGCGVADVDSDGDGVADCNDGCPEDGTKVEGGACGCGASDDDSDGDGLADCVDGCPGDANKAESGACGCGVDDGDTDGDGIPDCFDDCNDLVDGDGDGTPDCSDACPEDGAKAEPGQCGCGMSDHDSDGDGVADCNDGCADDPGKTSGGVCGCFASDGDSDGDGEADCVDGCPYDAAKVSPGSCGCGVADVDSDDDGVADCNDGCPEDGTKVEGGACGCGASDDDSDGDGLADCVDGCPGDANKAESGACGCGVDDGDTDGDGIPDCFDDCDDLVDGDGDGTPDCSDACPEDGAKTEPGQCGCSVADHDSDGDGVADCNDGCADDPGKTSGGVCGCGASDDDSDGDGEADCVDGCPHDAAKWSPGSCGCGVADVDSDGDGVADCNDGCPHDPDKIEGGLCGCYSPDHDSDGDGAADCVDGCPADATKTDGGACGCGVPDHDSDGDGVADCNDGCPDDPGKTEPGACACSQSEHDSDGDGEADCVDACPHDGSKWHDAGQCGCGMADHDSDGDLVADCHDGCPHDHMKLDAGECGCGASDDDSDGDGTPDCTDACPHDPSKAYSDATMCPCGEPDHDGDGDGVLDCHDACPHDPAKVEPGVCGCDLPDDDHDGDGTASCHDACWDDPHKTTPGTCGCGVDDTDSDGDMTPDCIDACPYDSFKSADSGACGCGSSDVDSDADGALDCSDGCPSDPNKIMAGTCGCGVPDDDYDGDGIADCPDGGGGADGGGTDGGYDGCAAELCEGMEEWSQCSHPAFGGGAGRCMGGCCMDCSVDFDGDGAPVCEDVCPGDPSKTIVDVCGCNNPDDDADGDGVADCIDTRDAGHVFMTTITVSIHVPVYAATQAATAIAVMARHVLAGMLGSRVPVFPPEYVAPAVFTDGFDAALEHVKLADYAIDTASQQDQATVTAQILIHAPTLSPTGSVVEAVQVVTEFGALQQALEEQVMQKLGMTLVEGSLHATVSAAPGSPLAAVQDSCSCDTATSHRDYMDCASQVIGELHATNQVGDDKASHMLRAVMDSMCGNQAAAALLLEDLLGPCSEYTSAPERQMAAYVGAQTFVRWGHLGPSGAASLQSDLTAACDSLPADGGYDDGAAYATAQDVGVAVPMDGAVEVDGGAAGGGLGSGGGTLVTTMAGSALVGFGGALVLLAVVVVVLYVRVRLRAARPVHVTIPMPAVSPLGTQVAAFSPSSTSTGTGSSSGGGSDGGSPSSLLQQSPRNMAWSDLKSPA